MNGKSFTVTTHTDFTVTSKDILEELRYATVFVWRMRRPANQAIRVGKVRKHIQAALNAAYHPETLNRTFSRSGM